MSEPQYQRYHSLPHTKLGIMANQLWLEDPKMLGIHLARYKFVAKMLAGKDKVAEIGCGDGWYSKVVGETVKRLHLTDMEAKNIPNIHKHDIVTDGALKLAPFDAIYALDVLEHIQSNVIDVAMQNIRDSLIYNGTFICGTPSLESQQYASPASKVGHVNCCSYNGFKSSLQQSFTHVFVFGMNDETLHTGFGPMCHYLIGVCCGVR